MTDRKKISPTTAKILKALSIFGSVQVITILCSVVRTKLVAIWLGPIGVGLISIYNQTIDLLSSTTQLNLRQSAVRDLSEARSSGAADRTIGTVRILALILGLAGTLLMALASPLLGYTAFDEFNHYLPFVILSPVMLLSSIASGEWAVMQGLEKLKKLAKSSLYSALTATAVSVPLFYFFRLNGIVPVLIVFAVCNCVFALIFNRPYRTFSLSVRQALHTGRPMLSLGAYMTVSAIVTTLASYIFIAYLNRSYSTDTVGLYQAGYTLINSYTGLIFTSIAMEYYPRLSASAKSKMRSEILVSHEISVALWVLIPVVITFICCRGLIVDILYSSRFEAILPYLSIGIIGIFFRALSWCVAFVIIARGDGRAYILTETSSAVIYLALCIPAFRYGGFAGLGIAYVLWYGAYSVITCIVCRVRYGMRLRPTTLSLLLCALASACLSLLLCNLIGNWLTLAITLPPAAYIAYRKIIR